MDFAKEVFQITKKYGLFALLFVSLFLWVINDYKYRETCYIEREQEYRNVIADSQSILRENQNFMKEQQRQLEGFKTIIEVKLEQIQKDLEKLRK